MGNDRCLGILLWRGDINTKPDYYIKARLIAAGTELKKMINKYPKNKRGLFAIEGNAIYITTGQNEKAANNKKSMETKFRSEWFPGEYSIGFSMGNGLNITSVNLDGGDKIELNRAVVYAAVKYENNWYAARITK